MHFQDTKIKCSCGEDFVFTGRDQEFYSRGGARDGDVAKEPWKTPKRCKKCRLEKKKKYPNG